MNLLHEYIKNLLIKVPLDGFDGFNKDPMQIRIRKVAGMKESVLRKIIREQILATMTPPEKEFTDGLDVLAGYIIVRDSHDKNALAYAPITRTDGPDRPFLVRTTDTSWMVPHGIVKIIYPEVEDVFNFVDSKEDWVDLGPGDSGKVGLFEWEWVKDEPTT